MKAKDPAGDYAATVARFEQACSAWSAVVAGYIGHLASLASDAGKREDSRLTAQDFTPAAVAADAARDELLATAVRLNWTGYDVKPPASWTGPAAAVVQAARRINGGTVAVAAELLRLAAELPA